MSVESSDPELLKRFILKQTSDAYGAVQDVIHNQPGVKNIGCVDPATIDGDHNLPGGLVFLYHNGLLQPFMDKKREGVLHSHLFCVYMFHVLGLTTVDSQLDVLKDARKEVKRLNVRLETNFIAPIPEKVGSAKPLMVNH